MKRSGGWSYVLAVVATVGAPILLGEVSAQVENATSGTAGCTRFIEQLVLVFRNLQETPRGDPNFVPTFNLYTRNNPMRGETLRIAPDGGVDSDNYNPERDTKFIIHGFLGRGTNKWIENLKDALLGWADVNVITVDWFRAATIPYTRAAANTAIVGQHISRLINSLIESYGGIPEDFHLIGHSLGSHVAGYAGGALSGLGRITALDPAGPLFATNEENNRLDPSDARFVDVIHTDKDCLGLRMPSGHVDFYPNGGTEQPGCAVVENFRDDIGGILTMLDSSFCSHFRAIKLFTESIYNSPSFNTIENENQCQFIGILCDTYDDFLQGTCRNDAPENLRTAILGIDADAYPERDSANPPPTSYYLQTNAVKPYCNSEYSEIE